MQSIHFNSRMVLGAALEAARSCALRDALERGGKMVMMPSVWTWGILSALELLSLGDRLTGVAGALYAESYWWLAVGAGSVTVAGQCSIWAARGLDRMFGQGWFTSSKRCTPEEVEKHYYLYKRTFSSQETVPVATVKHSVAEGRTRVFLVVRERLQPPYDLVPCGFFVLQFLSEQGVEALVAGARDGRSFDSGDLVSEPDEAAGLYIGAVGALTRGDRHRVMEELLRCASDLPHLRLFTRPTTNEGRAVAGGRGGFRAVQLENGIPLSVWESHASRVRRPNAFASDRSETPNPHLVVSKLAPPDPSPA
jgi:hypothetical protein